MFDAYENIRRKNVWSDTVISWAAVTAKNKIIAVLQKLIMYSNHLVGLEFHMKSVFVPPKNLMVFF